MLETYQIAHNNIKSRNAIMKVKTPQLFSMEFQPLWELHG